MSWEERAECRDHPHPEIFFSNRTVDRERAARWCMACPVAAECLADDLARGVDPGVRAAMHASERRKLLRQ